MAANRLAKEKQNTELHQNKGSQEKKRSDGRFADAVIGWIRFLVAHFPVN